jgi:hypothetical protein
VWYEYVYVRPFLCTCVVLFLVDMYVCSQCTVVCATSSLFSFARLFFVSFSFCVCVLVCALLSLSLSLSIHCPRNSHLGIHTPHGCSTLSQRTPTPCQAARATRAAHADRCRASGEDPRGHRHWHSASLREQRTCALSSTLEAHLSRFAHRRRTSSGSGALHRRAVLALFYLLFCFFACECVPRLLQ